jgi:Putative glycosyl hydrolase domain
LALSRIVGAFVFPEFWEDAYRVNSKLAHLRDCGVNAIMTESESYELPILNAAHKAGLRFFAGVACFSDHASDFRSLRKRPELWPVLENGERRPQMEWYVGITPTDRSRQEEALAQVKSIARSYPVDGIFLDFARWPVHWEIELRPGRGRPLDSSFDAATLAMFEEATGALPRDLDATSARAAWIHRNRSAQWIEFKCKVVNDFVSEAREALKEAKADAELGIYVAPDVNGLTEPLTGQRIRDLAPLVDWIAPMLYHNILLQPPAWIASTLAPVVRVEAPAATGDLLCRTPIGAKRFRRSPRGPTSAG